MEGFLLTIHTLSHMHGTGRGKIRRISRSQSVNPYEIHLQTRKRVTGQLKNKENGAHETALKNSLSHSTKKEDDDIQLTGLLNPHCTRQPCPPKIIFRRACLSFDQLDPPRL